MDCSTPGLPVHHQILEFTQTHVLKDSRNLSGNAGAVYYLHFLKAKNIHRLGTMKRGIQFLAGIIIKPALSRSVLTGLTLCMCLVLRTLSAWFYHRLMMLTCSAAFWIWLMNLPIVVQSLSHVQLFATSWTAARQVSLSFTISWSLLKLMSIESVMPSNPLILCHPLLLLPSIFPSIRVFSNESAPCIRWPKYWSFSFSISLSSDYSGLIPFRLTGLISLQSKGLSRVFSNTTVQKHQFFGA